MVHRDLIDTNANTRLATSVNYLIAGVPSNEWQDHGAGFGPVFTFPILPHKFAQRCRQSTLSGMGDDVRLIRLETTV